MSATVQQTNVDPIVAEIIRIVSEHRKVQPEGWNAESTLEDIEIDSFDFVELVFMLEDRYDIEIEYNANQTVQQLKTIGDVAATVQRLIQTKVAA